MPDADRPAPLSLIEALERATSWIETAASNETLEANQLVDQLNATLDAERAAPLTTEEEAIRSALHAFKWGRGHVDPEWQPPCSEGPQAQHVLETLEDAGWRLVRAERAARDGDPTKDNGERKTYHSGSGDRCGACGWGLYAHECPSGERAARQSPTNGDQVSSASPAPDILSPERAPWVAGYRAGRKDASGLASPSPALGSITEEPRDA